MTSLTLNIDYLSKLLLVKYKINLTKQELQYI